jgi:hypothetical protein
MDLGEFRNIFKKLIERSGARLGAAPLRARVEKQYRDAEDNFVDVIALNAEGEDDTDMPPIPRVEVPCVFWLGEGTGLYYELAAGTIVRVGFYDDDPHRPYLDAVIGGPKTPDANGKSFWIRGTGAALTLAPGAATLSAGTASLTSALVDAITSAVLKAAGVVATPGKVAISASAPQAGSTSGIDVTETEITATAKTTATMDAPQIFIGKDATEPIILGATFMLKFLPIFLAHYHADKSPVDPASVPTMAVDMPTTLSAIAKVK